MPRSMRPDRLAQMGITVPEIINAVQAQNNVNPAGKIGGEPIPKGQTVHLCRARAGPAANGRGI